MFRFFRLLVAARILLLIAFLFISCELKAVVSADFEGEFTPVSGKTDKHSQQRIEGEIDPIFNEDSSWADVEVTYSRLKENVAAGQSAQRIKVDRVANMSRVQLAYRDFALKLGEDIELSFFGKSDDYTPVIIKAVQKSPPYKTIWERNVGLVAEWKEIKSVIPGDFEVGNTQFHFVILQPGTVDIDQFQFRRVPAKVVELSAEKKGNLLTNSSFPLGHTSPWIIQMDEPVSASSEAGPSGAPALYGKVDNNNHDQSLRVAFDAIPNKPVTVSVHTRLLSGEVNMALRAGPADASIFVDPYQKRFDLTGDWQRYTFTVDLPVSNTGYYLLQVAFTGAGEVLLDGVQVEAAATSPEFKRTSPVELAVLESTYQGLYLDDAPFAFEYTAYGALDQVKHIQLNAYVLYGNKKKLAPLTVGQKPFEKQIVTLQESKDWGLGSYRLELIAVDVSGNSVSRPVEALLHRARSPRFAEEKAADSYFGTHYTTGHLSADGAKLVKQLGFNWIRLFRTFTWKEIEPDQKGEFFFAEADQDLEIIEQNHLIPLAILGFGSPDWARRPGKAIGWACWIPRDMNDWTDFVTAVFERYGDRVKYYETWNEPYYASFFTGSVNGKQKIIGSAEDYLDMHQRTRQAAPADVKILWNTNALEKLERTETLIEQGIMESTDAITLHHYTSQTNPKEVLQEQVFKMREAKGEKYKDTPIWNSEGGMAGALFNSYKMVPPVQENNRQLVWADWYAKYFLYSIAAGVEKYFPYQMAPTPWWRPDYSFTNVDGKLGPVIMGMSNMAWQIDGLEFAGEVELTPHLDAYIFSDGKRSSVVLDGFGKDAAIQKLGSKFKAYDLFGNPFKQIDGWDSYLVYLQSDSNAEAVKTALSELK